MRKTSIANTLSLLAVISASVTAGFAQSRPHRSPQVRGVVSRIAGQTLWISPVKAGNDSSDEKVEVPEAVQVTLGGKLASFADILVGMQVVVSPPAETGDIQHGKMVIFGQPMNSRGTVTQVSDVKLSISREAPLSAIEVAMDGKTKVRFLGEGKIADRTAIKEGMSVCFYPEKRDGTATWIFVFPAGNGPAVPSTRP